MAIDPTSKSTNEQTGGFRMSRLLSNLSSGTPADDAPDTTTAEQASLEAAPVAGQMVRRASGGTSPGVGELREELEASRAELRGMLSQLLSRKPLDQNVFDELHKELQSYKNDFFYERVKPLVRGFIHLFDAIEGFEAELQTRKKDGLCTDTETLQLTFDNLQFLRDQLRDALSTCEVFDVPADGEFDPILHRAVSTVKAEANAAPSIESVARSGWTLNGKVLRAADVVLSLPS